MCGGLLTIIICYQGSWGISLIQCAMLSFLSVLSHADFRQGVRLKPEGWKTWETQDQTSRRTKSDSLESSVTDRRPQNLAFEQIPKRREDCNSFLSHLSDFHFAHGSETSDFNLSFCIRWTSVYSSGLIFLRGGSQKFRKHSFCNLFCSDGGLDSW